jgi:L-fuconolactonase
MAELAASDLAWDVVAVNDAQFEAVVALARRVPELRIVVDHLARPPLETGDLDGWPPGSPPSPAARTWR